QDWFDSLWGTAVGCPDANCTSGYTTPAYDAAVKKADQEPIEQAIPDYQAVSRMLIQDAAYIPLYYSVGAFLIKGYVKGAGTNAFPVTRFSASTCMVTPTRTCFITTGSTSRCRPSTGTTSWVSSRVVTSASRWSTGGSRSLPSSFASWASASPSDCLRWCSRSGWAWS